MLSIRVKRIDGSGSRTEKGLKTRRHHRTRGVLGLRRPSFGPALFSRLLLAHLALVLLSFQFGVPQHLALPLPLFGRHARLGAARLILTISDLTDHFRQPLRRTAHDTAQHAYFAKI